jgi:hypothetical protein
MACRRVIKVCERVVKEFASQLPCYDLTRIVIELHCFPDSDQEQVHQTKPEMSVQTHPRAKQHRKSRNGFCALYVSPLLRT